MMPVIQNEMPNTITPQNTKEVTPVGWYQLYQLAHVPTPAENAPVIIWLVAVFYCLYMFGNHLWQCQPFGCLLSTTLVGNKKIK
jgi:hypothetical protein